MSGSNFNPQNTQCMDACPDFIGVVKNFAFLELEPRLNIKTDLTGQAKLSIFQRSPWFINTVTYFQFMPRAGMSRPGFLFYTLSD